MLHIITPTQVPGIGPAAAYAVGDQMGTLMRFGVPPKGTILEVRFHDSDDEGLNKELWLFDYLVTLAADNAAFSLNDGDLLLTQAVFLFDVWRDGVNNQIGFTANTPATYYAPDGYLYGAVKTLGTDNIAAGSEPHISMVIQEEE